MIIIYFFQRFIKNLVVNFNKNGISKFEQKYSCTRIYLQ